MRSSSDLCTNMSSFHEQGVALLAPAWNVHKFGGSSLSSAANMQSCIDIIRSCCHNSSIAVVVSAMGSSSSEKMKVTDLLLNSVHMAARNDFKGAVVILDLILDRHSQCAQKLFSRNSISIIGDSNSLVEEVLCSIKRDLQDIKDLLRAVTLMRFAQLEILELVSGYGELWSATILSHALRLQGLPFLFVNARDVLRVSEEDGGMGTKVHYEESGELLAKLLQRSEAEWLGSAEGQAFRSLFQETGQKMPHLLITGYIAASLSGVATTLKRDGSDFSASIFGNMLKAQTITIWTDVSGVYSADPRRVTDARIIPNISYTEAVELAYFGAKVLHPKTMQPAIKGNIPIYIRNTFKPENAGTKIGFFISSSESVIQGSSVCGFSTVDELVLVNLEGTGMIGVPGIAQRLFGALSQNSISVMFIAQASSEHSICFAIKESDCNTAVEAVELTFFYELERGLICNLKAIRGCSIVAAVGENMMSTPGIAGVFFAALGAARVNILSIAQGCDERNISAVVYSSDATRALRAVHSAFWLSSMDISIGIIGTGRIGSAVIKTLLEQIHLIEDRFGIKLNIRGVINSRKMCLGENLSETLRDKLKTFVLSNGKNSEVELEGFQGKRNNSSDGSLCRDRALEQEHSRRASASAAPPISAGASKAEGCAEIEAFSEHMLREGPTPHCILIDCSTSQDIAELHPQWLSAGAHIVTANKRALAGSLDLYNMVCLSSRSGKRMYMSEVTIGASIPIKTTLNDILLGGDAISSIVGLMDVSCNSVLTSMFEHGMSFSESVVATYETGLFQEDIFEDLNGTDAAKQLLVLARELGVPLQLGDVKVQSLLSSQGHIIDNWNSLQDVQLAFKLEDVQMAERVLAAKNKGCTLRYVQRIECKEPIELGYTSAAAQRGCTASVTLEEVPIHSTFAQLKGPIYHFAFNTRRCAGSPLVIQGPHADSLNIASGIVGDILRVAKALGAKDKGPDMLKERANTMSSVSPKNTRMWH